MSSNMLSGDKRWVSARRGGMTVLGKVAVPKPLNLPSQRLENHGLDPNVEIVPKGTLSWGSRSSSSASNAWGSSRSPNADGGTNHPGGRPSSGGSGTPPSIGGSDRNYEPSASAWSSNSRPSSASETLISNQISLAPLRPRSAENRPNSSPLSRFAEPVTESSVAWGPNSSAGRLGERSSKDGFSLSSGDFPSLGSGRDNSVKNIDLQDYHSGGRPISASGRIAEDRDSNPSYYFDPKCGALGTWNRDDPRHAESSLHPNMEKWQGEPQQHANTNVPLHHFDTWHGPSDALPGVWYRGPPVGPPFHAPVGPGVFPMEPFSCYRPQISHSTFTGPQPVPPAMVGPRGAHSRNGDVFSRSQLPDAYACRSMPLRPGFYPSPMAFEGYYGPPMGYCNANDRDIPHMGMATGAPAYNRFPDVGAPDPKHSHVGATGHGYPTKTFPEQLEADSVEIHPGPQQVPLKNQNERYGREDGTNGGQNMPSAALYPGKGGLAVKSFRTKEWGADEDREEDIFANRVKSSSNFSPTSNYQDDSSDSVRAKCFEVLSSADEIDDSSNTKSNAPASFLPEKPGLSKANEKVSSLPDVAKDRALMQKIEGLNAKIRDGRHDFPRAHEREEQRTYRAADLKVNDSITKASKTAGSFDTPASGEVSPYHEVIVPEGVERTRTIAVSPRRQYHSGQNQVQQPGKGTFNSRDAEGWQKKSAYSESSFRLTAPNVPDHPHHAKSIVKMARNFEIKPVKESFGEVQDSIDIQSQRAKMNEVAKQRALQRQKEEEERIREQKAKASAKLEELNRRTQAGIAADIKSNKEREEGLLAEPVVGDHKLLALGPSFISDSGVAVQDRESITCEAGESASISRDSSSDTERIAESEPSVSDHRSGLFKQDPLNVSSIKSASQSIDGRCPKIAVHKQTGYKQQQHNSSLKNLDEKSISNVPVEAPKNLTDVSVGNIPLSNVASTEQGSSGDSNVAKTNITAGSFTQQRRKRNKQVKNKQEVDEAPSVTALSSGTPKDSNSSTDSIVDGKSMATLDVSVSAVMDSDKVVQAPEVQSSVPNKEAHNRARDPFKVQNSGRATRSRQASRSVDKFHNNDTVIWAPVHSRNKGDTGEEADRKHNIESSTPVNSDNLVQNSSKSKRAEMERYVPKPVAKELAQQGAIQQVASSNSSDDAAGQTQPGSINLSTRIYGSGVQFREGDGRHNKQGKTHGTWRQRSPKELVQVKHACDEPPPTFDPSMDFENSLDQDQLKNYEINPLKSEPMKFNEINTSDSDRKSKNAEITAHNKSSLKDQGEAGRGKCYHRKVHSSIGNNQDAQKSYRESASAMNQTDRNVSERENQSSGQQTSSQWQLKSKKDHPPQSKVHIPSQSGDMNQLDQHQPIGELNEKHCDNLRERKPVHAKGRPYSPNRGPVDAGEAPLDAAGEHERKFSPSFRRYRNQNDGFGRNHESNREWSSVQSNQQHKVPAFRNRQRQDMHSEYLPVGPYKNNRTSRLEGPADVSNEMSPTYRDRGQINSKHGRGNFHRCQSGSYHTDTG